MRLSVDWRDRGNWTALSLGLPLFLASAVIVWGYFATQRPFLLPDPTASPLVALGDKGAIAVPATLPPLTPTPTARPGFVRLEGLVVDELGGPLADVCVAIGPNGCRATSPRTDARGVYFFDFAPADVEYDLHYTKDGYREVVRRQKITAPTVLNVVLAR